MKISNSLRTTILTGTCTFILALANLCSAAPEWLIHTGDGDEDERTTNTKTVTIPAGRSAILVVVVASEEYPDWTGPSSEFNDVLEWDIDLSVGDGIDGSIDVNNRHTEWEDAELEGTSVQGFSPAHVERIVSLNAPDNAALTVTINVAATNIGDGTLPSTVLVGVLPVTPLDLFPVLLDGADTAIAGSATPRRGIGETNGMVEQRMAHTNRIAHREIQIEIEGGGEFLEGKTVTWSMDPLFVAPGGGPPAFRGDWALSTLHPNRFEVSANYGANGFAPADQATATTELDSNGRTAVRINLAPIGFNKARVRVEVEDSEGDPAAKVIDMEVPAVVVVDAGHGGTDSGNTSGTVKESVLALEYAQEVRTQLQTAFAARQPFHRVVMTRTTDTFVALAARPQVARDQGADVFFSVHFNGGAASARGAETLIRGDANINIAADRQYADLIQAAAATAVGVARTPGVKDYSSTLGPGVPSTWAVLDDPRFGNVGNYRIIRGCIQEVDFLSNPTALGIITGAVTGPALRSSYAAGMAPAIITDIETQP